jgi:hypothetical protein
MPTKKQLHNIWETQFLLFGGHAIPQESNLNPTDGFGLTQARHTDATIHNQHSKTNEGTKVGRIELDANNELIITLDIQSD